MLAMFVVVPDYYTPDHPDGGPSALQSVTFTPSSTSITDSSVNIEVDGVSGPGVTNGTIPLAEVAGGATPSVQPSGQ